MNKYIFVTIMLVCFLTNGYAQKSLSDYSYIVIPEQFDFLSEKDKYQINSLTEFLFNKYGFNAFLENQVPDNLVTCDGLKANVVKSSGIIYTKLQIIINDCHGNEVYRSAEGKSKIKAYNKVFSDALRKAFKGIIGLNVNQKDVNFKDNSNSAEVKNETISTEVVKETKIEGSSNQTVKKNTTASNETNLPSSNYSTYKKGNELYLLKKTNKGYSLYEDKSNGMVLLGEVLISNSKVFYLGLEEKLVDAYFDESLNLVIENPSEKVIYTFVD